MNNKLKKMYQAYCGLKFPPNQIVDSSDIFARLALLDGDLAGLVSSFIQNNKKIINLSADIKLIEDEVKNLSDSQATPEVKKHFLNYINEMEKLNNFYLSFFKDQ